MPNQAANSNSQLVQAKDGFQEKSCAYNERRRESLKFSLPDFVYLIQELCGDLFYFKSLNPKITCLLSGSLNQINKIR